MVPIVEPDVSNQGNHDLETCQKVTETVLAAVYKALNDNHVFLEGTLLKPNFVTPGLQGPKATVQEVGDATITAFRRNVPMAVPGIFFLSGGLGEELSSLYLNAVNKSKGNSTWRLSYSYGRALTGSAWKAYGKDKDVKGCQTEFLKKAQDNFKASHGNL